jgi:hypothetical protein
MRKAEYADIVGPLDGGATRNDGSQRGFVKIQNLPGQNQKPMFISGVETTYPAENWVPVSVWLEPAYVLDDLCSGELYLSAFDLSVKPMLFPRKWKHQSVLIPSLVTGHAENGEIEGGPKIMDNISDYEGPFIRDRFISFGNDRILASLRPMLDDKPKGVILHEFFDLKPKLVDMLLGSPDL